MNVADAAYVAGILDGEGYLYMKDQGPGRGRPRPAIEVSSIDAELIAYLLEACGGWAPAPREPGGNRNTEYRWRISGRSASDLCREIAPFMRINRKRAKAEELASWRPAR